MLHYMKVVFNTGFWHRIYSSWVALVVISYILCGSFLFNGTLRVADLPAFPPRISTRMRERILPVFFNSYLATIQA